MTSKSKPEIQKIELTEEQKQEVQDLMDGKPTNKQIAKWDKQGKITTNKRHYQPMGTEKDRLRKISDEYFQGGKCMICHKLPSYKVLYKMEGFSVVEFYCDNCFDKWKSSNKK